MILHTEHCQEDFGEASYLSSWFKEQLDNVVRVVVEVCRKCGALYVLVFQNGFAQS